MTYGVVLLSAQIGMIVFCCYLGMINVFRRQWTLAIGCLIVVHLASWLAVFTFLAYFGGQA